MKELLEKVEKKDDKKDEKRCYYL